ncbi:hypothetical protein, partial [Actinocorallia lasiicapitis]
ALREPEPSGARRTTARPVRRPRTEVYAPRTLEQHPRVNGLIMERLLAMPERSIRESKRMLNTWQLYERVLSGTRPLSRPADAVDRACHLVIVAEIVTRWPALQRLLHRRVDGRRSLELLAEAAADDERWEQALELTGLAVPAHAVAVRGLRRLLVEHDGVAVAELARQVL